MSSKWVNILLASAFGAVLALYYIKSGRTRDHVDYMEQSLSTLKKQLPPDSRLQYLGLPLDSLNGWETYLIARYILSPVVMEKKTLSDTALLLFRNEADAAPQYIAQGAQVLWEYRDSIYHYVAIKQKLK